MVGNALAARKIQYVLGVGGKAAATELKKRMAKLANKRCKGPLHPPGGADIPLDDFTYNRTGPRVGKPLSRCKFCRSSGNAATIPASIFMPLVEKLFDGRKMKEVVQLTGLNRKLLRDLQKGKRKRIYKTTFLALKRAVASIPTTKTSIGPQSSKSQRNGLNKLSYDERMALRQLVSESQKQRYKVDRKLLKHVI